MPLITMEEIESLSPLFKGEKGHALANRLLRLTGIDQLSQYYERMEHLSGPDFISGYLDEVGVRYSVTGMVNLQAFKDGPFITVSNHPYGALDGLVLIDLVGHLRPDFKVMANKFLSMVKTIKDCFISVVPSTNDSIGVAKESVHGVRAAMEHVAKGHPLGLFPAGAVSDFHFKGFRIYDREWQKSAVRLVQKLRVPVVPIRFFDHNSMVFYFFGMFGWKARSLRLPKEILNKRNKIVRVGVGEVLPLERQVEYTDTDEFGRFLRDAVYRIKL